MSAAVDWRGRELVARLTSAALAAATETVRAAAEDARSSHWWRSRSGRLQSNITAEPARIVKGSPGVISARFGTTQRQGFYGLFLERRTPFMRPAADRHFPQFAAKVRARL
ncbi:MAG: hypothetical protein RIB67_07495 [Miltoncostaeaceae bacterium]